MMHMLDEKPWTTMDYQRSINIPKTRTIKKPSNKPNHCQKMPNISQNSGPPSNWAVCVSAARAAQAAAKLSSEKTSKSTTWRIWNGQSADGLVGPLLFSLLFTVTAIVFVIYVHSIEGHIKISQEQINTHEIAQMK